MNNRVISIAGGSGSGKTTLAEGLINHLGDRATLLSLDEYQKSKYQVPCAPNGRPNFDHPDAVDWPRFLADLDALRAGVDIFLQKKPRLSPDGGILPRAIVQVPARPFIIVEGYLALWHRDALPLYDLSLYLDSPERLRLARRRWVKDPQYINEVLLPMHQAYVEPTRVNADLVIYIAAFTREMVLETALVALAARGFI
ncbi:MAG: hypothetical protein WCT10_05540 [Patescibacteria group bacterium]|jgi:uridine kinase